ncbi:permease [Paenibacillus radicis (ex Xue et al. 2023)]|uniref:Permease n=1 Tax=Paenibacillus radicis (ex Xue et al. 2023) TaxID=2972489 RepID=A0ABT1YDE8_9BACL|nr:permease [Paenibacillus radicis (ex Xue et al. 2023)]MCR8631231.1 permease [Paenibacillus radicis (ex Xue et al. 2023)]
MRSTTAKNIPVRSNSNLLVVICLIIVLMLYLFSAKDLGFVLGNPKLQVFKMMLISIIIEAMPFILIGVFVSALLQVFVSELTIRRLIPRNPFLGIVTAGMLGIIFPICECGMVPAIRNLIKKGMPLYVASTFILVGPILNPIVFLSTLTAFRNQPVVAYSRMGVAIVVALVVGLIIYRFVNPNQLKETLHKNPGQDGGSNSSEHSAHPHSHELHSHSSGNKLLEVMSHSISEFFQMGKYLVFGSILVGLLQIFISQNGLASMGNNVASSNLIMMGLGFILSLCSTADAFVAQSFQTTFSNSSLVGFMVFGPMLNLKSLLMMLAVFRTKFVVILFALVFVLVFASTIALHWMLN